MLSPRAIDIEQDRDVLLDFHCRCNYEVESPWVRAVPFERYQRWWLETPQPEAFLADLSELLRDPRTVAEFWEDAAAVVAYVSARFIDLSHSGIIVAEVGDLFVIPERRRQGVAQMMLSRVEQLARERGAHLLRSGTGIEDGASQKLHAKAGFQVRRFEYEKVLKGPPAAGVGRTGDRHPT